MIYTRLPAGLGYTTIYPSVDVETYSEAGYVWIPERQRWRSIAGEKKKGSIFITGAPAYAEHPSTCLRSLAYCFWDGRPPNIWFEGLPPPYDLFEYIQSGGIIQAWNSLFEYFIWHYVAAGKMGWPELPLEQLRDGMPKARAFGLPGKLAKAGEAINAPIQKLADGQRLLKKFSVPRNPTKKDPRKQITLQDDHIDAAKLLHYNIVDIESESAISKLCPDLSESEQEIWAVDQRINVHGVAVDMEAVEACIEIVNDVTHRLNAELQNITCGQVSSAGEIQKIGEWLYSQGFYIKGLKEEYVSEALARTDLGINVRRVLEIRQILSMSSIKKLYSIKYRVSSDGRLRDLLAYHRANTGRFGGKGPQPQNLPSNGPDVWICESCALINGREVGQCPACGGYLDKHSWNFSIAFKVLQDIKNGLFDPDNWENPLAAISGCLRALFISEPGKDLICSDYRAIEAVVSAAIAGEQWRLDVFNTHGLIYEMSASKITGVPFEEFIEYKKTHGEHHPMRKKVGKISELASVYQGSVSAWKKFGADKHIGSDEKILEAVRAWRKESPMIVKLWYGLEDAARAAIQSPGHTYTYRAISYMVWANVLYCQLPSGRCIHYQAPRLHKDVTPWGKETLKITYMGQDDKGNWTRRSTYGGKLCENVVQAISRDILCHALVNLERAGYLVVLHVHDEIVAEIIEGWGSVEEFERIMGDLPAWAKGWPVIAAGGWRGKNYRKD